MKKTILTAVVALGFSGGVYAQSAIEQLKTAAITVAGGSSAVETVPVRMPLCAQSRQARQLEWVSIPGGKFVMGTDNDAQGFKDAKPLHEVAVKTFEMAKAPVTVEQYAECVNTGACEAPGDGNYCNWGVRGREHHPINCVNPRQAAQYAKFAGARLPSEAEWEYAARSGGKVQNYPWGNQEPTCALAVMDDLPEHKYADLDFKNEPIGEANWLYASRRNGCGKRSTWPVCSKPAGNSEQGLCDMAGNVWQMVQDSYDTSYALSPVDGTAFIPTMETPGKYWDTYQVTRGGSFSDRNRALDAYIRSGLTIFGRGDGVTGFRLAR